MGLTDTIVNRCRETGGAIGGVAADVSDYGSTITSNISNSIDQTISNISNTADRETSAATSSVDNTTSEVSRSSWLIPDWITNAVNKVTNFFKSYPNNIWTKLKDKVVTKITDTLHNVIKTGGWLKDKIIGWIEDKVKTVEDIWGDLENKVKTKAKDVIEKAVKAGGWLKDKIENLAKDVIEAAVESGGWLKKKIIGWIEDKVKTIEEIWAGVEPKVKALIPTVIELLGAAPEALYTLFPAKEFWNWFVDVIKTLWGEVEIKEVEKS